MRPDFDISKRECPPRRRSEAERNIEEAEVRKMADLGVLEPSNTPSSTIRVCAKANKSFLGSTKVGRRLPIDV
jgi:hypothetical protein